MLLGFKLCDWAESSPASIAIPGDQAHCSHFDACRLKAQAGVAAALAGFCDAVVGRGKGVATGAALRDCLLAAAMLLQAAAAACESLAQQLRCPRPKPLHTPGTGRGKKVQCPSTVVLVVWGGSTVEKLNDKDCTCWTG